MLIIQMGEKSKSTSFLATFQDLIEPSVYVCVRRADFTNVVIVNFVFFLLLVLSLFGLVVFCAMSWFALAYIRCAASFSRFRR